MSTPQRILIVDDDPNLLELLRVSLERSGYLTTTAKNGLEGEEAFKNNPVDLAILDVMMPHRDGFALTQIIRQQSSIPIILLTARQEVEDVVKGLELGADDYITKPFNLREVIARVSAVLSRIERQKSEPPRSFALGGLTIDLDRGHARVNNHAVALSPLELELLHHLMSHPGKLFERDALLQAVWGYDHFGKTNLVDVAIRRLREKIERDASDPQYILTVRGQGYRFATENEILNDPV